MVMRKGLPAIRLWSLHALLLMGLCSVAQGQARFYGLGFLHGDTASTANAVSDSALVVGYGNQWAFVWRPATGMRALEFPNAQATIAYAVSADGVVAGQAIIGLYGYACYWDEAGAYRIHSRPSMATGVSHDGRTIAGWAENRATGRVVPFVFNRVERQLAFLPEPAGSAGTCFIYCVSGDGRVLGGMSMMRNPYFNDPRFGGAFTARGHVWIDGVPSVRALPSGGFGSQVNGLSYDGTYAVGSAQTEPVFASPSQAVLWEGANPTLLGTLGGAESNALSTDRLGRQVVGSSRTADGNTRAFYWTRTVGMVSLQDHFAGLIPAGWTLTSASGISPNGRYIVGIGQNPQGATEAWLLDTGRNCYSGGDVDGNGCVDDADLLEVLLGFGRVGVADVNCDGIVNDADLLEVLFNFGNGC
jgi:probable HAF family extracellular repeat protein